MSLVQVKVVYSYYSTERITPLYINEDELFECNYEDFKTRVVNEIPFLRKTCQSTALRLTVLDNGHQVDISPTYFPVQMKAVLQNQQNSTIQVKVINFNSPGLSSSSASATMAPTTRAPAMCRAQLSSRFPASTNTYQALFPSSNATPVNPCMTPDVGSQQGTSKPLDRKVAEMRDNLTVLDVQIKSAKSELENCKSQQEQFASNQRGRACNNCHLTGHTKKTCKSLACDSVLSCKNQDKHPEMKTQISQLQAELKALMKKHENQKHELENFVASREKSASSFFAVMRPRLRLQNLPKYTDRLKLDKDLMVLQRALQNKVPTWIPEDGDWQLPVIIEQYRHWNIIGLLPAQIPTVVSSSCTTVTNSNQQPNALSNVSQANNLPYGSMFSSSQF